MKKRINRIFNSNKYKSEIKWILFIVKKNDDYQHYNRNKNSKYIKIDYKGSEYL